MHLLFKSLAAVAFLAPMVLESQVIIDQNAPTVNAIMAQFDQPDLAQSFRPLSSLINGAGIYLYPGLGTGTSTVTISLWDLLPNVIGANQLATGSTSVSANGMWVDVGWSEVSVVSGQTYYLVFSSTIKTYAIAGDENNGYANGQVFANAGFATFQQYNLPGFPADPTIAGSYIQSFDRFDYTFRTLTVVPEPASVVLVGSALMLLGGMSATRRGKRSNATSL